MVRPGANNEELRYSLRALAAHVPHDVVWIVGFCPAWLTGVQTIPIRQTGTKWQNSTVNVASACAHPWVSDEFLLFNDDMFVMAPVDEIPVLHRGPVDQVVDEYAQRVGSTRYVAGMRATSMLLDELGYPDPLSYELHVPMPVRKDLMGELLEMGVSKGIPVLHKRTLYGNVAGLGGRQVADVKVCANRPDWSPDQLFLSTDDTEFASGAVGDHIRSAFPEPCRYEVVS